MLLSFNVLNKLQLDQDQSCLSFLSALTTIRGVRHKASVCTCTVGRPWWWALVRQEKPSSCLHFRWQLNILSLNFGAFLPKMFFVLYTLIACISFLERYGGGVASGMKDYWRQRQMTNNTWPISSRDFMEEQLP